jgi:DNA mismatch repair protein MutS
MNVSVSDEGGRIVFLHKVVPGGADRSYGVHVADLAGLPPSVVNRARALLRELEKSPRDPAAPQPDAVPQLALFTEENAAVAKLRHLDPNTLSPIEALTALFELKKLSG